MEILFENSYYRVSKVLAKSPSNITFICYDHFLEGHHITLPSAFGKPFARGEVKSLGFNHISVQSRANDLFQRDGILEALEGIAKIKGKEEKYISYGASQGAYASINFFNITSSDIFLAIAPVVTSNKEFMEKIGDFRTYGVEKFYRYDFILDDLCLNAYGLIVYDPTYPVDEEHVKVIKEKTESEFVFVPGGEHSPGKIVNDKYGIKKILKQMPDCIANKEYLIKLASDVNASLKD